MRVEFGKLLFSISIKGPRPVIIKGDMNVVHSSAREYLLYFVINIFFENIHKQKCVIRSALNHELKSRVL